MKNLKKIINAFLSISMLASNINFTMAEEAEILYSYEDDGNNTINVTQADFDAGHWDDLKMNQLPLELYEDFPAIVNGRKEGYSHMKLDIDYLKNITAEDNVTLNVTNRWTNEVIYDEVITNDTRDVTIKNMTVGNTYTIKIDETFGTESYVYTAVIDMQYEKANMPKNVSLTNGYAGDGISLPTKVLVEEVVDESIEDEAYIPEFYAINTEELSNLYNTLNSQKIYKVNTSIIEDGEYVMFSGYFSKKSEYSHLGIFTPGYKFYTENEYETLLNSPMVISETNIPDWEEWDYDDLQTNTTKEIKNYTDYFIRGDEWKLIKVVFEETGSYEFATFGNYQVQAVMWWYVNNDGANAINPNEDTLTFQELTTSSTNKNIVRNLAALKNSEVYFFIRIDDYPESGEMSDCVSTFRVRRTENSYANDRENSVFNLDLSVREADANNIPDSQRTKNNSKILNEYIDESLEYRRDTDSYFIDTSELGYYSVSVTNNSEYYDIKFVVLCNYDDIVMTEDSDEILVDDGTTEQYNFRKRNENYEYYISVYYTLDRYPGLYPNNYTICAANQDFKDEYEGVNGNNVETRATLLTDLSAPICGTIAKSDKDWYKFTTGDVASTASLRLESPVEPYYMYLYDEVSLLAEGTRNSSNGVTAISDIDLEPNTTYSIWIYGTSSIYSSAAKYNLLIDLE